jgi:hypothetical protein
MRPNSRLPMADPYHQNRGLLPPPSPQSKPAEVMLNRVASCNPRLWHGAQVHSNLHFNSNTFLSPNSQRVLCFSYPFHTHSTIIRGHMYSCSFLQSQFQSRTLLGDEPY